MNALFDILTIPGWGQLLFFDEGGELVPDFLADSEHHESDALRRELWIVAANAYIYQDRPDTSSGWGSVWLSDCGEYDVDVSTYTLTQLSDLVTTYWNDPDDDLHPMLKSP